MEKRSHLEEKAFLRYFFRTYIPPYTSRSITDSEEIFKDIFLSAITVWAGFRRQLNHYTISDRLKSQLLKLFELWEDLWEKYLIVTTDDLRMGDRAFRTWASGPEIQNRWNEIRLLANEVDLSGRPYYAD